jgi:hypothetical protein
VLTCLHGLAVKELSTETCPFEFVAIDETRDVEHVFPGHLTHRQIELSCDRDAR